MCLRKNKKAGEWDWNARNHKDMKSKKCIGLRNTNFILSAM